MKPTVVQIDGAIVMPSVTFEGGAFVIPQEHDTAYKYLIVVDGMPFASKDLTDAVLAVSVLIQGKQINPMELIQELGKGA